MIQEQRRTIKYNILSDTSIIVTAIQKSWKMQHKKLGIFTFLQEKIAICNFCMKKVTICNFLVENVMMGVIFWQEKGAICNFFSRRK